MYTQKSFVKKPADVNKTWYLVDASDMVVGRLATQVASILRGKTKPDFTPNVDCGDNVIIVNCEKVKFTGTKWDNKKYFRHTGYIGGLKQRTAKEQLERAPERILMSAVRGMLPKTSLGRKQLSNLRVCVGENHGHEAQQPVELKV